MAISRVKTWSNGEVLTHSDLNAEFDNILNNALSLISPLTGELAAGGNDITGLDELALSDASASASAVGRIRRNSTRLTWHNGTAAKNLAYTDETVGFNLISTQSATNSATIDFSSGLSSTYDWYMLTLMDIIPATDASDLYLRVSQSAAFLSGAADYRHTRIQNSDGGAAAGIGSVGDTQIVVANALTSDAASSFICRILFANPSGSTRNKFFFWQSSYITTTPNIISCTGSGALQLNTTAIDGVRFLMSAGNITSGKFTLYGLRLS